MIYKQCDRCHKKLKPSQKCSCIPKRKNGDKQTEPFYLTKEWRMARIQCIKNCYGLDIFSFYQFGIIQYGFTVHHIYPVADYWDKRLLQSNLIYLTESNHRVIHNMMKQDFNGTVKTLLELKQRFEREYRAGA